MSVRVLLLLASVALLGFAPAPFPKPERPREVASDVTGTWVFEKYETYGASRESEHRIEMTREKVTFISRRGNRTDYDMRMNPKASPPSFIWSCNNTVMIVGSYRVRNGKVEMIGLRANNLALRPTDFASKPMYHYVLRRINR